MELIPTTDFADVGTILVCQCPSPIARRVSRHSIEAIKFHGGKVVEATYDYHNGTLKIECNKCKFGWIFVNIEEVIGINDRAAVKLA